MISRRNYFSIVTLMFVILFLFMSINDLRDWWNDYMVNTYTETAEKYPSKVNFYVPGDSDTEKENAMLDEEDGKLYSSRSMVIMIGDSEGVYGKAVREWVTYSRRNIAEYDSLKAYANAEKQAKWPEMLVIEAECVDWEQGGEIDFLMQCIEEGTHLVFCTIPDVSVIKSSSRVRDLLGIRRVEAEEISVAGLHLYSGFLLGGERVYLPTEAEKEEKIVFPGETDVLGKPSFPWYLLTSGTKVYMKGVPEDQEVDTEDYPVLIWRKSFGTAYVFAVNGGYMKGAEGIGILSAMSAEMYSYEIYPVVNAQNMVLTSYPGLADENRAVMDRFYGRSVKDVFQEILWTNISTIMDRYRYKVTCMMTPQYDYLDDAFPDGAQFIYYLKIFNEASVEVGLSGMSVSDTPIVRKLAEDGQFVSEAAGTYSFSSFYAGNLSEKEVEEAMKTDVLTSVMTIVREYEEGDSEIVGLLSESVTSQMAFDIGFDYTYKGDFLVRCLETALGYMSIAYDIERIVYPESEEDTWEKLSVDFGTTIDTFSRMFSGFDSTTVSESDMRIWRFLTLHFNDSRKGNTLRVEVSKADGTGWFLLRTHNEAIKQMEGGSWKQLEEGVYLIAAEGEEVLITLEPADERYYQ